MRDGRLPDDGRRRRGRARLLPAGSGDGLDDCCDHAPTALAAVSVLPERDPAAIVALVGGSTVAVAEPPVDMRFLPDRKEPRPPLDCLARTCVLRN